MSGLVMRQARLADLPGVLEILGKHWPSEAETAASEAEVGARKWEVRLRGFEEEPQEHPQFDVRVLAGAGAVLAVAATKLHSGRRLMKVGDGSFQVYLEYLAVRCDQQGEGYGRQLEEQLVAHWMKCGYRGAYLQVEPHRDKALDFWEKRGWQRAPEAYQPASGVLMTKQTA